MTGLSTTINKLPNEGNDLKDPSNRPLETSRHSEAVLAAHSGSTPFSSPFICHPSVGKAVMSDSCALLTKFQC